MFILKQKILSSLEFTQIISGESEFSLNILRDNKNLNTKNKFFHVLPNGYNSIEYKEIFNKVTVIEKYAITVGSFKYKKLKLAFDVFKLLKKKNPKLSKFIIIGKKKEVPRKVLSSELVEIIEFPDIIKHRKELVQLLSDAEYFISASQIENSSIAALEGLVFSKKVILSDIPSHRELLKNIKYNEVIEKNSKTQFLLTEKTPSNEIEGIYSWKDAIAQLHYIHNKYKDFEKG